MSTAVAAETDETDTSICKGKKGQDQSICLYEHKIGHQVDCTDLNVRGDERTLCRLRENKARKENRNIRSSRANEKAIRALQKNAGRGSMSFQKQAREAQNTFKTSVQRRLLTGTARARGRLEKSQEGRRELTRRVLIQERKSTIRSDESIRGAGRTSRRAIQTPLHNSVLQIRASNEERLIDQTNRSRQHEGAKRGSLNRSSVRQPSHSAASRATQKHVREQSATIGTDERRERVREIIPRHNQEDANRPPLLNYQQRNNLGKPQRDRIGAGKGVNRYDYDVLRKRKQGEQQ